MVPLMAVAAGMQVMGAISAENGYKFNYEMQKINASITESNIKASTDFNIEQQLKGFNDFIDQFDSLIGQQKSVLATQQVSTKSSAYTEVRSQQEKDYYENVNILEDNIQNMKNQENLSILANNTNLAAQEAQKASNISSNRINTIAQLGTMAFSFGQTQPTAGTQSVPTSATGGDKLKLTIFG